MPNGIIGTLTHLPFVHDMLAIAYCAFQNITWISLIRGPHPQMLAYLHLLCISTSQGELHCISYVCRSQESQSMIDRITDEVNSVLSQEGGKQALSKQAVLDLIDQGASQGGPQARKTCFTKLSYIAKIMVL